jgi:hypothetical protein
MCLCMIPCNADFVVPDLHCEPCCLLVFFGLGNPTWAVGTDKNYEKGEISGSFFVLSGKSKRRKLRSRTPSRAVHNVKAWIYFSNSA